MQRGFKLILPFFLLVLSIGTGLAVEKSHELTVHIPQFLEMNLSETTVDFGTFMVATGHLLPRLVTTQPLTVTYRCNSPEGWSLSVAATDFSTRDSAHSFSVDHLSWGTDASDLSKKMPQVGTGSPAQVAAGNTPVFQSTDIYYGLDFPEQAYAGDYVSTVTYTLVAH